MGKIIKKILLCYGICTLILAVQISNTHAGSSDTIEFYEITKITVSRVWGIIMFKIEGTHDGNPVKFSAINFNLDDIRSKWTMDACERMALLVKTNPEKYSMSITRGGASEGQVNFNSKPFEAICTLK